MRNYNHDSLGHETLDEGQQSRMSMQCRPQEKVHSIQDNTKDGRSETSLVSLELYKTNRDEKEKNKTCAIIDINVISEILNVIECSCAYITPKGLRIKAKSGIRDISGVLKCMICNL